MNYKNGKYILDDGHIVPPYEAIQIYNEVEYNSRKEEVYDMYLSIHKNVPEDFFDSEQIRELTDEDIDEITNKADDLTDILYNICKNAKVK